MINRENQNNCILCVISLLGHWYLCFYWLWLVGTLQYMVFENNSRGITIQNYHWGDSITAVITRDSVTDETLKSKLNLKRNIALFLLAWFFQYIRNWSPTFLQYTNIHTVINLNFFSNFSVHYTDLIEIGLTLLDFWFLVHFQLWICQ